jgi:integrase
MPSEAQYRVSDAITTWSFPVNRKLGVVGDKIAVAVVGRVAVSPNFTQRVYSVQTTRPEFSFFDLPLLPGSLALLAPVSYVNGSMRVLRRILRLAVKWGVLDSAPKIELLPGERHRERVITLEEEARYLGAAPALLACLAAILLDTGLRPDECHRLRWEDITWENGRNGTVLITHGKTKAARRVLPMTPRVRSILEERWQSSGRVEEGWVWPAPTKSGHMDHFSVKTQHQKTLRESGVRPFVLYSLRHTFLTRLGASGCDAWTLARIAGHSSIAISSRYVHPSEDAVLDAISRLGGHSFGHSQILGNPVIALEGRELAETEGIAGGPSRI